MDRAETIAHLRAVLETHHSTARPARTSAGKPLSTGYPPLDEILPGGGLPRGALTGIYGPLGSGKTSVALRLAARQTRSARPTVWIDLPREFYPPSAEAAGIDLGHLLGITPRDRQEALACCDLLLRFGATPLIILDLSTAARDSRHSTGARLHWAKLHTLARRSQVALVVLYQERRPSDPLHAFCDLSLELSRGEISVARCRASRPGRRCPLELLDRGSLGFSLHPALPSIGAGAPRPDGRP